MTNFHDFTRGVVAYNKDGGPGKIAKEPSKSTTKRTTTLDANSPKLRNFIVSALKDDGETTLVAEIANGEATLRVNPELVAKFLEKAQKKPPRPTDRDGSRQTSDEEI